MEIEYQISRKFKTTKDHSEAGVFGLGEATSIAEEINENTPCYRASVNNVTIDSFNIQVIHIMERTFGYIINE